MSENLDLVRTIGGSWERGDFSSAAWADPKIEYVFADGPDPASWQGMSEMAEGFRAFVGAWVGYRIDAEEYRALDGERVLVLFHDSGRGRASGLELRELQEGRAFLFCLSNCRVTRLVVYWDRSQALADLGLEE